MRAQALALIEQDLAKTMGKKAAQEKYLSWLTEEKEEPRPQADASGNECGK